MENFEYCNPTKIVFGKGTISKLTSLIPRGSRVMVTYGGGSIKKNGVHEQVASALKGMNALEFGGIEPNPRYETCMKAVAAVRKEKVDFLLAVGGGSVLDGTKFIAAAVRYDEGKDPWEILVTLGASVKNAIPLASVLTLPATGSEMNNASVMSRESTKEKKYFCSDCVRPLFSILDPETTYSLPEHQTANGIVDTFVHVMEQYMTYPSDAPLQDRQAESILTTLIEEASKVRTSPRNYAVRANLMWCATQALNNLIGCGVPQDWATHMIGHEVTALYGLDHGQTLAAVLPGLLRFCMETKKDKLVQYAERVWHITEGDAAYKAEAAIGKTEQFFRSVGVKTRLEEYGVPKSVSSEVAARLSAENARLGEHGRIGGKEAGLILDMVHSK